MAKPRSNVMKDMEEKWELFITAVSKISLFETGLLHLRSCMK